MDGGMTLLLSLNTGQH